MRYGVGYDNIDIEYCKKNNILVANTPDYGIDEVSDSAIAMILYLLMEGDVLAKAINISNIANNNNNFIL